MGRAAGWSVAMRAGRRCVRPAGPASLGARCWRFWDAVARGCSTEGAAAVAGVSPAVGARWFRQCGGMRNVPHTPVTSRFLSFSEREEIAVLRAEGHGVREIARRIGRDPATVSREVRRNAGTRSGTLVPGQHGPLACSAAGGAAGDGESWRQTSGSAGTCRSGCPAQCTDPTGSPQRGHASDRMGDVMADEPTVGGHERGARNRSRTGSRSTSPTMSRCESATRRSTRRCMCRAGADSTAS